MKLILLILCLASTSLFCQKHADAKDAFNVNSNQKYIFKSVIGIGNDSTEAANIDCFLNGISLGQGESNSIWLRFTVEVTGLLGFVISPEKNYDDIDFVLYELPDTANLQSKKILRCMAAGGFPVQREYFYTRKFLKKKTLTPNIDKNMQLEYSPCLGKTGLAVGEKDISADSGCNDSNDNNWLSPLLVEQGKTYLILVNNGSSSGNGFSIIFTGEALF
jgi:hypothetical protein